MSFFQLALLSLVQGITEFLPISSSGHLILVGAFFEHLGAKDQGLMIDVGAHFGTLAAVCFYFHARMRQIFVGCYDIVRRRKSFDSYLVLCLIVGTIPVLLGGAAIMLVDESLMRHVPILIVTSVVFGAVLWWADHRGGTRATLDQNLTVRHALLVGLAQLVALIPGTSRSGITMSAARLLGYGRVEAAKFSFLLSIPATAAAVVLYLIKIVMTPPPVEALHDFFIVAGLSFIVALGTIHYLLKWLSSHGFLPFVLYRFALAAVLAVWVWG